MLRTKFPKTIIFDLDGTLVDTIDPIIRYVNESRVFNEYPARSKEELKLLVGLNPQVFFKDLNLEANIIEALVVDFRARLNLHPFSQLDTYPGTHTLLNQITNSGRKVGIATNKPTENAKLLLRKVGLLEYVSFVQGSDDLRSKPEPDIVLKCMDFFENDDFIFVGDKPEDVLAGKAAKISTVALLQSGTPKSNFELAGADLVISSLAELTNFYQL